MERFNQQESEGAQCRARTKWQVDGEKPSKFFCSLEKHNSVQKYIPQLKVRDSENREKMVSDQKNVEKEIYNFYKNLYKSQEPTLKTLKIDQFLKSDDLPHPILTEYQAKKLDRTQVQDLMVSQVVFLNYSGEILNTLL